MSVLALPLGPWDSAVSEESECRSEATQHEGETSVSYNAQARLSALRTASSEAAVVDWDGYGAEPVSPRAVFFALELLLNLPETWPSPEIAIDPDGDVNLEWRQGARRVVSISVNRDGVLYYAGFFGDSRIHGAEGSVGELPHAIVASLARLFGRVALPGAAASR